MEAITAHIHESSGRIKKLAVAMSLDSFIDGAGARQGNQNSDDRGLPGIRSSAESGV